MYSIAQYGMGAFSLVVLGALVALGRMPERVAAFAFLIAMFGTPMVDGFYVGGVRVGVAALSLGLFASLFTLGLSASRWWLLAAAGVQLLSLTSWLVILMIPQTQIWAGVSFRMILWLELMTLSAFGVWEARYAPYALRSGRVGLRWIRS